MERSTFTEFDQHGRPTSALVPAGDGGPDFAVRIAYDSDANSIWTFVDGSVMVRDDSGAILRQELPDGSLFSSFDGEGRPTEGQLPSGSGPDESVHIDYGPDGTSTWTLQDGTVLVRDPDGVIVREVLPDGTAFSAFGSDGRPTAGVIPAHAGEPGQAVHISYGGGGESTWTFDDGTRITRGPDGTMLREAMADGSTFSGFDSDGRPTVGTIVGADGQPKAVAIRYFDDGGSDWALTDGTHIRRDASGVVTHQVLSDGQVLSGFDDQGRPTEAMTPGDGGGAVRRVEIAYSDRGSEWCYDDGSRVVHNAQGAVIRQVLPDGSVYSDFDAHGRPTAAVVVGTDGEPARRATISYAGDGDLWHFDDGTQVSHDSTGAVVRQVLPDGGLLRVRQPGAADRRGCIRYGR